MSNATKQGLPPAQGIAVAYATKGRDALIAFFQLDIQCAAIVRRTTEPLLSQMKLAWWRDCLMLEEGQRPRGNALLDNLAEWGNEGAALAEAASSWEHLVGGSPLDVSDAMAFATARAEGFAAFARLLMLDGEVECARVAGMRWSLADLASHVTSDADRKAAIAAAATLPASMRLSRPLRPFAVLDGLARRSLARGGAPLLADRASALLAFRLGLFGR